MKFFKKTYVSFKEYRDLRKKYSDYRNEQMMYSCIWQEYRLKIKTIFDACKVNFPHISMDDLKSRILKTGLFENINDEQGSLISSLEEDIVQYALNMGYVKNERDGGFYKLDFNKKPIESSNIPLVEQNVLRLSRFITDLTTYYIDSHKQGSISTKDTMDRLGELSSFIIELSDKYKENNRALSDKIWELKGPADDYFEQLLVNDNDIRVLCEELGGEVIPLSQDYSTYINLSSTIYDITGPGKDEFVDKLCDIFDSFEIVKKEDKYIRIESKMKPFGSVDEYEMYLKEYKELLNSMSDSIQIKRVY